MSPTATKTPNARVEALEASIYDLAYPTTPLTLDVIDSFTEKAQASGSADLCGKLIMTVHGRGAVLEARKLADRFLLHFPDDPNLVRIRNLVGPPRPAPPRDLPHYDRRADLEWLKSHAAEYPGEWLVLSGGVLWGHHPRLKEAQKLAQAAGLTERPLLHQVPPYQAPV